MENAHRRWTPGSRTEQQRAERNTIAQVAHQFFDLSDITPSVRKNGSLMILLDRPFQVGDLIRTKGHEGPAESVGLRSTRIRDVSGHVVSISNEEMARLDSKNLSSRSHLRRQEILRLRADTRPEKIQSCVAFVRGVLENHEGKDSHFPPTVRIGFGDAAATVTITYYYRSPGGASPSTPAFEAFNEQVTLRILEPMQEEGIQLAPAGHATHGDGAAPEHATHEQNDAGHATHEPAHTAPGPQRIGPDRRPD